MVGGAKCQGCVVCGPPVSRSRCIACSLRHWSAPTDPWPPCVAVRWQLTARAWVAGRLAPCSRQIDRAATPIHTHTSSFRCWCWHERTVVARSTGQYTITSSQLASHEAKRTMRERAQDVTAQRSAFSLSSCVPRSMSHHQYNSHRNVHYGRLTILHDVASFVVPSFRRPSARSSIRHARS